MPKLHELETLLENFWFIEIITKDDNEQIDAAEREKYGDRDVISLLPYDEDTIKILIAGRASF